MSGNYITMDSKTALFEVCLGSCRMRIGSAIGLAFSFGGLTLWYVPVHHKYVACKTVAALGPGSRHV